MAEQYYTPTVFDVNFPTIVKSIIETLKVYICNVLYPDEEYVTSKERFILVDFTGGDDASVRRSVEQFKTSQAEFPFTAYGEWDNLTTREKSTHIERSGTYYSSLYECYVKSVPAKITVPMVSFFATAADYERAHQLLYSEAAIMIRLNVPISVNSNVTYFPIDINMEVSKGAFAGEFDTYLRLGNIFGLNHNFGISFRYVYINANDQHGNTPTIAPVDDIYGNFYTFNNADYRDTPTLRDTMHNYLTPEISSSVPSASATSVDKTANIVLTFNTAMNYDSLIANVYLDPFFSAEFSLSSDGTILTIEPVGGLTANTSYTITIPTTTISFGQQNFEWEYSLQFTTGN